MTGKEAIPAEWHPETASDWCFWWKNSILASSSLPRFWTCFFRQHCKGPLSRNVCADGNRRNALLSNWRAFRQAITLWHTTNIQPILTGEKLLRVSSEVCQVGPSCHQFPSTREQSSSFFCSTAMFTFPHTFLYRSSHLSLSPLSLFFSSINSVFCSLYRH